MSIETFVSATALFFRLDFARTRVLVETNKQRQAIFLSKTSEAVRITAVYLRRRNDEALIEEGQLLFLRNE